MPVEFRVFRDGECVHVQLLGEQPIMVGRGPNNDLVLAAGQVSWNHATLWLEGGRLWVKDLGSTNGTFVDHKRLVSMQPVELSSRIRLGSNIELRFTGTLPSGEIQSLKPLVLADEENGVIFTQISDRFFIGSGAKCDLVLPDGPDVAAVISFHEDGEVWASTDEDERPLDVGDKITVGGRTLVLRHAQERGPTIAVDWTRYPLRLTVDLQGAAGPEAMVEDLRTDASCVIRSSNRAVLLYILARRLKDDREENVIDSRLGWCNDEEVSSGIWGRNWKLQAGSHLHVLIHRLRSQIKGAGIDPWFIEKKRRHIRVRVEEVVIRS